MDFRILGPLELEHNGRSVELGGARQRALLAILLLRRNGVVSTDRIIEELYDGQPPPTAAKSLQAHVSRLRGALRPEHRLHTRPGGYVLEVGPDELDADRAARLLAEGRTENEARDHSAAATTLTSALALWRGQTLADVAYERFAQAEVARLEELRLSCLEELAEARLALGRHAELVIELERLVAEQPLRERLRAQHMLALYRVGRQADALAVYQDGRRVLVEELGIDPGRMLQELERAILNHDAALDPPTSSEPDIDGAEGELAGSFVGRARELSVLDEVLSDSRDGRGRFAIVSGEAGIGKSRLVDELATRARRLGFRVLWGRCWEAGGAPAYWPWVQALRTYARDAPHDELEAQLGGDAREVAHLLPELRDTFPAIPPDESPDTDGARFRLYDSTSAFLRRAAEKQPILLVLDDVHAADASSLLLVAFAVAELADARIALVATYREPELEPGSPAAAALADVARRAGTRISLRGLRQREVAAYIEQTAGEDPSQALVAAIAAETDGNPLFVGEIVRLLAADGRLPDPSDESWRPAVPESVKEVIGRRLQRLSAECRATLGAASVVGRDFPLNVLEALEPRPRDELLATLDEAVAARLVTDAQAARGHMRFAHALVRDTLYDDLHPGQRRNLHRRAAEAISSVFGEGSVAHLSELAHHYAKALPAVDPDVVVDHAQSAGDQANAMLAYEEAARLYETALQAISARSSPLRARETKLLLSLGEARTGAGDTPGAKDAFLQAAVVARETGAAEDLAAAALGYGGRLVWARPYGDRLVVALLEEALDALPPETTALRARLLARLSGALRDERDPRRRVEAGELAVATARQANDPTALVQGQLALSVALYAVEDHDRRLKVVEELHELARMSGDWEAQREALNAAILLSCAVNDFAAARARTQELADLADERRQPSTRWIAGAMKALLALHGGRFLEAEELITDAYEAGRQAHPLDSEAAYVIQLYLLRREQGRAEDAHERLAATAAASPARPFFKCARAALAADLAHSVDVRRLFEELAPNRFEVVPRDNEWPLSGAFLVEGCRALGDTRRAEILYEELEPLAERSTANMPEGTFGAMARSLGIAAAVAGRETSALAHLRDAIEIDTATGGTPWVAYAQVELADLLERAGDTDDAASLRREAAVTAAALGMQRLSARIARDA